MTKSEKLFHDIASGMPEMQEGKMFGALCIKAPNGKAGVMFWKDDMIFKLPAKEEEAAMALKGAKIFEPADGRKMNGWVHVPNVHTAKWKKFAAAAMEHVASIEVEKKIKNKK